MSFDKQHVMGAAAEAELRELLAKVGWTRLVADYIPEGREVEEGWRIHDFPEGTHIANFIVSGIEDENEAMLLVALANTALEASSRQEERLSEVLERIQFEATGHAGQTDRQIVNEVHRLATEAIHAHYGMDSKGPIAALEPPHAKDAADV